MDQGTNQGTAANQRALRDRSEIRDVPSCPGQRRCVVHADAFYESKVVEGGKQPYAIARQDGKPLAFAGIWESVRWSDETVHPSFAIMTTMPNAEMDELHDRMPVILEEQDWSVWLAEAEGNHRALLRPAPDGTLRMWPVDRRVGSPRNNGPELLEAVACLRPIP